MTAWWRRLDRALMLRAPRLWQTRLHQALALALPLHALVALLTLGLARPVFMTLTGDVQAGVALAYMGRLNGASPQLILAASMYSDVVLRVGEQIAAYTLTLGGLVLALSVIPALLLARAQGWHSVEAVHGARNPSTAWLEWFGYALGSALFAALPLTVLLCLQPTPAQYAASARIDAETQTTLATMLVAAGLNPADHKPHPEAGDGILVESALRAVTAYNGDAGQLVLVPAARHQPVITLTRMAGPGPADDILVWQTDANPAHAAYRSDLRAAAYVQAFSAMPRWGMPHEAEVAWNAYLQVGFWWIVALNAWFLYMRKRAAPRRVVMVMLALIVGLQLVDAFVLFFVMLVVNMTGQIDASGASMLMIGVLGLPVLLLFAAATVAFGVAFVARIQRRAVAFGLVAWPILLAMTVWVLIAFLLSVIDGDVGRLGLRDEQAQRLVLYVLALAPFLHVPGLGLLDRALVRHASLPLPG